MACNGHCKELETALLLADSSVILQLAQIGLVREAAKQKPRLLHNFKTVARGKKRTGVPFTFEGGRLQA